MLVVNTEKVYTCVIASKGVDRGRSRVLRVNETIFLAKEPLTVIHVLNKYIPNIQYK